MTACFRTPTISGPSSSIPSSSQRMGMTVVLTLLRSEKTSKFGTFMLIWNLALALSVVPVTSWMSNQNPCFDCRGKCEVKYFLLLLYSYFLRIEAFHSVSVLLVCPQEVRPGENDRSSKLTDCHVKHPVTFLAVLSGVTTVPDIDNIGEFSLILKFL